MYHFRITYKTKDNKVKTEYVSADHGAEAQEIARDDFADLKKIIKVEQL